MQGTTPTSTTAAAQETCFGVPTSCKVHLLGKEVTVDPIDVLALPLELFYTTITLTTALIPQSACTSYGGYPLYAATAFTLFTLHFSYRRWGTANRLASKMETVTNTLVKVDRQVDQELDRMERGTRGEAKLGDNLAQATHEIQVAEEESKTMDSKDLASEERLRKTIEDLNTKIGDLERNLLNSTGKIATLENDLQNVTTERENLHKELASAIQHLSETEIQEGKVESAVLRLSETIQNSGSTENKLLQELADLSRAAEIIDKASVLAGEDDDLLDKQIAALLKDSEERKT